MTSNLLTGFPLALANKGNSKETPNSTYDYQVNWIEGEWTGITSSGWFTYEDSACYPSLSDFSFILNEVRLSVVYNSTFSKLPLYWDGIGLNISEEVGGCKHVLLDKTSKVSTASLSGYYISFIETALGRLIYVYSSSNYTYMGSGQLIYEKRTA